MSISTCIPPHDSWFMCKCELSLLNKTLRTKQLALFCGEEFLFKHTDKPVICIALDWTVFHLNQQNMTCCEPFTWFYYLKYTVLIKLENTVQLLVRASVMQLHLSRCVCVCEQHLCVCYWEMQYTAVNYVKLKTHKDASCLVYPEQKCSHWEAALENANWLCVHKYYWTLKNIY